MMQQLKERFHPQFEQKKKIDQVVAIVFKNIQNQPLSILFLQRCYNEKDPFSGDICFPGGYREKGESPTEAAIRETYQETGINLNTDGKYIGMLDNIPYTRFGRSKFQDAPPRMLHMGIFLFQINKPVKINLNPSQIRDHQWISFQRFFIPGHQISYHEYKYNFNIPNNLDSNIKKIKYVRFPSLDIGMNSGLWGLTLFCIVYLTVQTAKIKNISQSSGFTIDSQHIINVSIHCFRLKVFNIDGKVEFTHLHPFRKAYNYGKLAKL